tara:strand:+ start:106 stop:303 length:198 start_codon:yes stop_codon:yes gene_type:complete
MAWKPGKTVELNNSLQIATWRQVLGKESKHSKKKLAGLIETHKDQIEQKNDYMKLFMTPQPKKNK